MFLNLKRVFLNLSSVVTTVHVYIVLLIFSNRELMKMQFSFQYKGSIRISTPLGFNTKTSYNQGRPVANVSWMRVLPCKRTREGNVSSGIILKGVLVKKKATKWTSIISVRWTFDRGLSSPVVTEKPCEVSWYKSPSAGFSLRTLCRWLDRP